MSCRKFPRFFRSSRSFMSIKRPDGFLDQRAQTSLGRCLKRDWGRLSLAVFSLLLKKWNERRRENREVAVGGIASRVLRKGGSWLLVARCGPWRRAVASPKSIQGEHFQEASRLQVR